MIFVLLAVPVRCTVELGSAELVIVDCSHNIVRRFTPPETSRHGRARAEHGAGATLEVLEGANGRRSGFGVWTQHVHYITNRDGELAAHPKVKL